MKNLKSMLIVGAIFLAAPAISGCVQLGLSQSQSEASYTDFAIVSDGLINSGKLTGDIVGYTCTGDTTSYNILKSTRNPADGVKSYAPADGAHGTLQTDGAKQNSKCTPPTPLNPGGAVP